MLVRVAGPPGASVVASQGVDAIVESKGPAFGCAGHGVAEIPGGGLVHLWKRHGKYFQSFMIGGKLS